MCRTGNAANRTKKGEVKDAGYIIVIQSGVWYNFSVVDSDKYEIVAEIELKIFWIYLLIFYFMSCFQI